MRRPVVIVSIVVVALIVIAIAALSLLDVNKYKPRIEAELQSKLGRQVTLGQLSLRLLPFSVKVDGLTIGESPAFPSNRPFATAKEVYASASLFSLLRGQPTIKSLTLDNPQIELIQNASGVWNFSSLGGGEKASSTKSGAASTPNDQTAKAPTQPTKGEEQPAQESNLTLDELKIQDGQVGVTDERTKKPRVAYNHIDLKLTGFAPGKQFDIDLAAHFPGQGKELLSFTGKAGPLQAGNAAPPISGRLSLQEISAAGLNSIAAGAIPPKTDGSISGDANLTSEGNTIGCKGTLKVDNPVVQGAKVPYPIEAAYDLSLDRTQDETQVRSGNIKVGPTAVALSGSMNSRAEPASLNMRVSTKDASIVDLGRLASAFGVAFNADDQVKGSLTADLTAQGPTNNLQIQGKLSANPLQAQDLVLQNVNATCKMNNGVVQLAPVTATVYGGQENGTITVDTKPAHPLCSVKMNLSGVDTNALLSAVSSVKNTLYGKLAANGGLTFTVESSTNLARSLNGDVNFGVTNGQLKNVNILNELAKIGKFVGSSATQSGPDTALQKLGGTLNIKSGVASTNNLVAALQQGSLSAVGTLDLATNALNMHMNAVLASGTSKAVGGTSVGGFLNTALANNQGELVLPVLVTGTTAHPIFAPDVQALAKMKLNHLLPTSGDPTKANSGLVGSVLGGVLGKQSGQQGNTNNQQQNPLNSIFNKLGKKKQ